MRRREFLAALGSSALAPAAPAKPNIVVILADDLGYGDVGCYNPESKIPTPRLDGLARQGMRFTDAHSPSGVCSPTRYGLLTGRYCWRGVLKQNVLWPYDEPIIEKNRLTLPGMLKQAGYRTGCIGKWHLGWNWHTTDGSRLNATIGPGVPAREERAAFEKKVDFTKPVTGPTLAGFDTYFGDDLPNFTPYTWFENDRIAVQPTEPKPKEMFGWPGVMAPGWTLEAVMPELTRRAVQYVRESASSKQPFFLYFPLTSPHEPVAPDKPFLGKSQAGKYGDFVYESDWAVGQVLDAIKDAGAEDNTLVIFTSDNGPENPAYERIRDHGHRSSGPLRGIKRHLWEGGHRVPFLAKWPGRIQAGSVESETICHVDLLRTIAAIVGARVPRDAAEDSYDIGPALFGRKRSKPIREATVHHSLDGQFAIRQGDWVFLDSPNGGGGRVEPAWVEMPKPNTPGELFNLREDLGERSNRYAAEPAHVQAMKDLLEKYKREGRSTKL